MCKTMKETQLKVQNNPPANCHTVRHSIAPRLLANGNDIRTIEQDLGHKDVSAAMICTHVLNRGGSGGASRTNQE